MKSTDAGRTTVASIDAQPEVAEDQGTLPGVEVIRAQEARHVDGYLCCACWRRIPVGQHDHACFYEE